MSKAFKALAYTALAVATAATAASWWAGGRIQQQMQNNLSKITQDLHGPAFEGEILGYSRGLFSSEIQSRWDVKPDEKLHFQFQAKHRIAHAPWNMLDHIRMDSEFSADKNSAAAATKSLAGILGEQAFGRMQSTFSFSGTGEHHLKTVAIDDLPLGENVRLSLAATQGVWRNAANYQSLQSDIQIPSLKMDYENTHWQIENLQYQANNYQATGHDIWLGTGEVKIGHVSVENIHGAKTQFNTQNLKIYADLVPQDEASATSSTQRNGFLTRSRATLHLEPIIQKMGDMQHEWTRLAQLDFDFQNLDARFIQTLMREGEKINADIEAGRTSPAWNSALGHFLAGNPSGQFKAHIQLAQGALQGEIYAAFLANNRSAEQLGEHDVASAQNIKMGLKLQAPHLLWAMADNPSGVMADLELMGILRTQNEGKTLDIAFERGDSFIHGEKVDIEALLPVLIWAGSLWQPH